MDAGRAPVNIVFWGEERRSRTSAHMLAVAGMLSAMHRSAEVMPGVQKKRRRAEFYLYDMGAGLDSRKRHILWRADLVVVNLRQEEAQVKRFFSGACAYRQECVASAGWISGGGQGQLSLSGADV